MVEQGDRIVIAGPTAVEGLVETEPLSRLAKAAQGVVLAVAHLFRGVEVLVAAMIAVVMGEHEVVHIAAPRVDALHVSGNPLAGMAVGTGQDGHSQLASPDGVMVAAVEKHRRAVGEYQKHGLGHTGVDEVHLELAAVPSLPSLTHQRVFRPAGEGRLEIKKDGGPAKSRRPEEVSSIHLTSDYCMMHYQRTKTVLPSMM